MRPSALILLLAGILLSGPVAAAPLAIHAENATKPTQCAEEDNVYVKLFSPDATRFTVEALQPAYMAGVRDDVKGPNFTNCKISAAKDFTFSPKTVVLYEDRRILIKGFTFARFWRNAVIPTSVGGKVTEGLHLIQVFAKGPGKPFEFLVLYPPDGYWRARPRPLPGRGENVYGSSFLIGPVTEGERPVADVARVEILPRRHRFVLHFKAGGSASLDFDLPGTEKLAMRVKLDRAGTDRTLPFAALRSMFVTETNADTARVLWHEGEGKPLSGSGIASFEKADATDITFDRALPSVHNTSAPDMRFGSFGK